jgi:hypothetical protein
MISLVLAKSMGMPTGRDRLHRLVRALPDLPIGDITVLGVDEFAIKRGQDYGTVLIDCETSEVVDVLLGRDAEPVTAWLQEHANPAGRASRRLLRPPNVTLIVPPAVQVVDVGGPVLIYALEARAKAGDSPKSVRKMRVLLVGGAVAELDGDRSFLGHRSLHVDGRASL